MAFNVYTFRIIRRLHGGGGSYCGGAVMVAVVVEVVAHDGDDGGPLDPRDSSTLVSACWKGKELRAEGPTQTQTISNTL